MKYFRFPLILLLLLNVSAFLSAQDDDLLDVIAQEACDCIDKKDISNISKNQLDMELGMCMMESIGRHPDAINELDLDLTDQAAMQRFGEKIGMRMVARCPTAMMQFAGAQTQVTTKTEVLTQISGTFKGVEGDEFAFLTVEGDDGTAYRLLWLDEFDGADQLEAAKGKQVKITYKKTPCYSPRLKRYLDRKEVTALEIIQ